MPKKRPTIKHDTREGWLRAAILLLDKEFFDANGYDLPASLAASCGFVKGAGGKAIGCCFDEDASAESTVEMFICPTQAEPRRVLGILLHEMIHACLGKDEPGHKGNFKKLVLEFGLSGKMTATVAEEGGELWRTLGLVVERLGPYPHSAMSPKKKISKTQNKWVRYVSSNYDNYKVVVHIDRVAEYGAPRDPLGGEMEPVN